MDERRERAREHPIRWMVQAVRRGDYLDALEWLSAVAAADPRFSLSPAEVVAGWRRRAMRRDAGAGTTAPTPAGESPVGGLFHALMLQAYDGIVISARADGWILECSESFAALGGYARGELLGRSLDELRLVEPRVRSAATEAAVRDGSAGGLETCVRRKDGSVRWAELSVQVLPGHDLLLTIVHDVTERRRGEERLRQMAERDPLTGLYNRRRLEEEVDRRLAEARRHHDLLTLAIIDLDEFKAINDRLGHAAGDRVLTRVADVLRHTVRETDFVARLGGDEFAVLLTRGESGAAERVRRELRRNLEMAGALGTPAVRLRPSIGIAHLDPESGKFEELFAAADEAMYRDKQPAADGARRTG